MRHMFWIVCVLCFSMSSFIACGSGPDQETTQEKTTNNDGGTSDNEVKEQANADTAGGNDASTNKDASGGEVIVDENKEMTHGEKPMPEPTKEPVIDGGVETIPEKTETVPEKTETVPEKTNEPITDRVPEQPSEKVAENVPDVPPVPPIDKTGMFNWLKAGHYKGWKKESSIHAATPVHSANARVFINNTLDSSLAGGSSNHPLNSVSVKELYSASNVLRGWAVMVKTQPSAGVANWYWYEVLSTTSGANPVAAGQGQAASICTGCHTAGKDGFLTKYPLQ